MASVLNIASCLPPAIGAAHTWHGERYIPIRLYRRDNQPQLFGSADFSKRTLRFAWHLPILTWIGSAAVPVRRAGGAIDTRALGPAAGLTLLAHLLPARFASRGKRLSRIVFLAIVVPSIYATRS